MQESKRLKTKSKTAMKNILLLILFCLSALIAMSQDNKTRELSVEITSNESNGTFDLSIKEALSPFDTVKTTRSGLDSSDVSTIGVKHIRSNYDRISSLYAQIAQTKRYTKTLVDELNDHGLNLVLEDNKLTFDSLWMNTKYFIYRSGVQPDSIRVLQPNIREGDWTVLSYGKEVFGVIVPYSANYILLRTGSKFGAINVEMHNEHNGRFVGLDNNGIRHILVARPLAETKPQKDE